MTAIYGSDTAYEPSCDTTYGAIVLLRARGYRIHRYGRLKHAVTPPFLPKPEYMTSNQLIGLAMRIEGIDREAVAAAARKG